MEKTAVKIDLSTISKKFCLDYLEFKCYYKIAG